jgi:hypothetical protein
VIYAPKQVRKTRHSLCLAGELMRPLRRTLRVDLLVAGASAVRQRFIGGTRGASALAALVAAVLVSPGCSDDSRPGPASYGYGSGGSGPSAQCSTEGEVRACSKLLSEHNGIINCFRSLQECRAGIWSSCGGQEVTLWSRPGQLSSRNITGGLGYRTQSLSSPSEDAQACLNNPCNPYCVGFDEQPPAPITPPYDVLASFEGNSNPFGNAPDGFQKKQDCSNGGDCRSGYPRKCNGDPTNYNKFDGCLADHHCDDNTGKCVRNDAGWTWPVSVCPGIDLTAGPSCNNGTNDGFPLCNRGNTAIPAGTTIQSTINEGNWLNLAVCPSNPGGTKCSITLSQDLAPGQCVRIIDGQHCDWNGNAVVYVNSNQAVAECGMPQPNPPSDVTAPGCSNNWSDVKLGSVCQTFAASGFPSETLTETYTATCPARTRVQWDSLAFDAVTACSPGACDAANSSSITFQVQTAGASDPTSLSSPVVAATAPTSVPSTCTMAGPDPCPVDLFEALGIPAAQNEILTLTVTLTPSPDGQAAATLNSWEVTYSCPPAE